jgi:hypothetical protein
VILAIADIKPGEWTEARIDSLLYVPKFKNNAAILNDLLKSGTVVVDSKLNDMGNESN